MSHLEVRLARLRQTQNADGGWGYFANRQSWLEPTAYAALALAGEPAADRAWAVLKSWQNDDGSLRPSSEVTVPSWGAALFVTLAASRGEDAEKATSWLLGISGVESDLKNRWAVRLGLVRPERDTSLKGWPWKPGNSSWVEPTAHTVVALKKVHNKSPDVAERIRLGQSLLMDVRCKDAGWNYGSNAALGQGLASYPETTGIALVGLQGRAGLDKSLDLATRLLEQAVSPMARAWLTIALRVHGAKLEVPVPSTLPLDLQAVALEALATTEGNHRFLKTEAA